MTECFPSKVARVDLDGYQARRRAVFADEAHTPRSRSDASGPPGPA